MPRALLLLAGVLLTVAGACSRAADAPTRIVVFASASLAEAMQRIASDFERAHPGIAVDLHCAGTPHLLVQAREGAPLDVFVSASVPAMAAFQATATSRSPATVFARNQLAIVVGRGNPKQIRSLSDLAREDLLVALCGESVPAGAYARQACAKAVVTVRSRSDEPSVKALLTKVRLGELDVGIVYATDLHGVTDAEGVAIPVEHNVSAEYVIAVATQGQNPGGGQRFVAWVLADAGQAVLASCGFRGP